MHGLWHLDFDGAQVVRIVLANGMKAGEVREGLARLGILHERTLPACPEQNGKQEAWWNSVEGRLLAMLERVP